MFFSFEAVLVEGATCCELRVLSVIANEQISGAGDCVESAYSG